MSNMLAIRVWCEYDFNGSFGGNNNEEVFTVSFRTSTEQIEDAARKMLEARTGLVGEELEGLWDWNFVTIEELV